MTCESWPITGCSEHDAEEELYGRVMDAIGALKNMIAEEAVCSDALESYTDFCDDISTDFHERCSWILPAIERGRRMREAATIREWEKDDV